MKGEYKLGKRYPFVKLYTSEAVKKEFEEFYELNKEEFQTKTNFFRRIVENLPLLAKKNSEIKDTNVIRLKEEIRRMEEKIVDLQSQLDEKDLKLIENNSDISEGKNNLFQDQLNRIEEMLASVLLMDERKIKSTDTNSIEKERTSYFESKYI